jgi:hypothetical protein
MHTHTHRYTHTHTHTHTHKLSPLTHTRIQVVITNLEKEETVAVADMPQDADSTVKHDITLTKTLYISLPFPRSIELSHRTMASHVNIIASCSTT